MLPCLMEVKSEALQLAASVTLVTRVKKLLMGLRIDCSSSIVLASIAFSIFIIQILHVSDSGLSQAKLYTCHSESQTLLNWHYPCIAWINALSKYKLQLRNDMSSDATDLPEHKNCWTNIDLNKSVLPVQHELLFVNQISVTFPKCSGFIFIFPNPGASIRNTKLCQMWSRPDLFFLLL